MKIKNVLKHVILYVLLLVILLSSYFILMTLSSLIPSTALEKNARESSEILLAEGEKKFYKLPYKTESIFTFTDALMINTAYSINNKKPVESFMLARKNYIPGQTKNIHIDSQYDLGADKRYINEKNGDLYQTKELYGLMHGENIQDSFEYARYWHGYLVVLRPLLAMFNYSTIRIVLLIVTIITILAMLILLYKKINLKSAIIYGLGLLLINIFFVTQSINEILIFIVAFISTIVLLLRKDKIKNIGVFFFVVGSISSFIDLLTAPLVTFGITAIAYFLLLQKEKECTIKDYIIEMLKIGFGWLLGYGLTWLSKWIITEVVFHRPLISQAIEQAIYRTKVPTGNRVPTAFIGANVIFRNIDYLGKIIKSLIIIFLIVIVSIFMFKNRNVQVDIKGNLKRCIPYIFIGMLPFAWYLALKQHSVIHAFFTHRILVISIIALFIIGANIFEEDRSNKQSIEENKEGAKK